ncbi:MAG: ComF family protein [Candidatus Dormibacteria bacterium]
MAALARLEGPLREAIHRLKYGDRPQLAEHVVAMTLLEHRVGPGTLVPVPLHRARLRRRGYNQAELLVRAMAGRTGAAWVDGLERVGRQAPQVGRGGPARRAAMSGAFRWRAGEACPAAVVIVDDVLTTGTTLLECALAVRAAGVKRVEALAIALG